MLVRQSVGHQPAPLPAGLHVPAAHLGEQDVQHKDDGYAGGNGTHLQGAFVGAALEHHVRQGRAGGFGEAGDQDELRLPLPAPPGACWRSPGWPGSGRPS